jgi:hypothetical protein
LFVGDTEYALVLVMKEVWHGAGASFYPFVACISVITRFLRACNDDDLILLVFYFFVSLAMDVLWK